MKSYIQSLLGKFKSFSKILKVGISILLFSFVSLSVAGVYSLISSGNQDYRTQDSSIYSDQGSGDYKEEEESVISCVDAQSTCETECGSVSIINPENGEEVMSHDFESNCEEACLAGFSGCEDAPRADKCDEFGSSCRASCPNSVYDYESDDYIYTGDNECEDACMSGSQECEN